VRAKQQNSKTEQLRKRDLNDLAFRAFRSNSPVFRRFKVTLEARRDTSDRQEP
jgi:hypothetical protein